MDVPLWLVLLGLVFPAVLAFLDCYNREEHHFPGGAEDRRSWLRWLALAVLSAPILLGNGIVLGYYYVIVKRNAPGL